MTVRLPITLVVGGRPENCGSSQEVRLVYAATGYFSPLVSQWQAGQINETTRD